MRLKEASGVMHQLDILKKDTDEPWKPELRAIIFSN